MPAINTLVSKVHFKRVERVDRSDRILNIPMPPKHLEMEYAIDRRDAVSALRRVRAQVEILPATRCVAAHRLHLPAW